MPFYSKYLLMNHDMSNWTNSEEYQRKIDDRKLKVSIVGLGYVGLPLATMFASKGFEVVGYDIDRNKVEKINRKENYLHEEKWLTELLKGVESFSASTDVEKAGDADFMAIAVPTPVDEETKEPVYDYVEKSSRSIGKSLRKGSLVSLESTVGPGTTENLVKGILEVESGLCAAEDFGLVFSPERINPGDEKHRIDRIPKVVGGIDKLSMELGSKVYEQIVPAVYKVNSPTEAELVKLFENVQRDVNIALMNEFACICDKLEGVDIKRIIEAASTKWNFVKVYPGCGVGGHCLPEDPYFLIRASEEKGYSPRLIKTARKINDSMSEYTVTKACSLLRNNGAEVKNSRVAVLGIAYKENTCDMRTAPSKKIVKELEKKGIKDIVLHDPHIKNSIDGVEITSDLNHALNGVDMVIIATAHDEYKKLNPYDISHLCPSCVLVDGRNIFDSESFRFNGIKYIGIGRG